MDPTVACNSTRGVTTSSGAGVAAGGASQRHRYKVTLGRDAVIYEPTNGLIPTNFQGFSLAGGKPSYGYYGLPGSGKIRASAKMLEMSNAEGSFEGQLGVTGHE
ncbi:uncharacterized protein N7496_001047 [Penicillium cataractarum]|uniref:Uncharacterized protein n=1 Tax=Penicillium cataractarum TaxID=2100454 RepID=A0A9W9VVK8_9EURO|nr:uncharacterized protein N7496_001047 [Penicillium cataractarum]KAJ5389979.1 hypothetical protein N7496_001047 [Penicillium cataractarum]